MNSVKSIEWEWRHGKVFTEILYESGKKEERRNIEPPPIKSMS